MFKRLGRWLFWAAAASIAILGIALLVQQSEAFTNCIHDRKNSKEYQSLHEGNGIVSSAIIKARLRLNYVCTWYFTEKNNGAIVALATIALSIFTFTLWRSTKKLWLSSQEHADHAERAIKSAEQSAERQFRAYIFITSARIVAANA